MSEFIGVSFGKRSPSQLPQNHHPINFDVRNQAGLFDFVSHEQIHGKAKVNMMGLLALMGAASRFSSSADRVQKCAILFAVYDFIWKWQKVGNRQQICRECRQQENDLGNLNYRTPTWRT
jgi:hypothetical protein